MKLQLKFETIGDIQRFRSNLVSIKIQIIEFQATLTREIGEQIIQRIHQKMRSAGFSEKIIEGTTLDNIEILSSKKVRLFFRSEYFAKTGFDVALAREEGTDDHFIEPLSTGSPFVEKPEALHGGQKWPYFSKGHMVSGMLPLFIVRNTVKEMTPHLQDEYNRQFTNWLANNLGGNIIAS